MSRPIIATLFHKRDAVDTRRYARIDTAFPKSVQRLLLSGEPGDVVQFSNAEFGFWIGDIKIKAGGQIQIQWLTETTQQLRSRKNGNN